MTYHDEVQAQEEAQRQANAEGRAVSVMILPGVDDADGLCADCFYVKPSEEVELDEIAVCCCEPKKILTPECDRLARAEGYDAIREFLDWLRGEPELIEKIQRSEAACEEASLLYFGIDPKKLEAERRAILAERGDL